MELVLISCAGICGLALAAADVLPERVERIVPGRSSNASAIPANARGLQTLLYCCRKAFA
jgi:hypothetical protein